MKDNWISEWSDSKIDLALKLNKGECGGSYAEAVIILCSVLSGISADIWPIKRIDRKRFVELLIKYSNDSLLSKVISTPLLIDTLNKNNQKICSAKLFSELMPKSDTLVLTGNDIDKTEEEILSICPDLDIKLIRKNSYANILYEEIRSGFIHEYMPGERSDSWNMGANRNNKTISYINRADKPHRLIYFNVNWLSKLVKSIVGNIELHEEMPVFNEYSTWWVNGDEI